MNADRIDFSGRLSTDRILSDTLICLRPRFNYHNEVWSFLMDGTMCYHIAYNATWSARRWLWRHHTGPGGHWLLCALIYSICLSFNNSPIQFNTRDNTVRGCRDIPFSSFLVKTKLFNWRKKSSFLIPHDSKWKHYNDRIQSAAVGWLLNILIPDNMIFSPLLCNSKAENNYHIFSPPN